MVATSNSLQDPQRAAAPAVAADPVRAQPPALGSLADILAQAQALEARLRELEAQLLHSHRLATLGTLTSIVAHEYNNILTPILSYAQLALASPDDRDLLIKAVEKAQQGAERAARISASILGFARGDEDDPPPLAHVRTVVEQALACLARDPARDGIAVRLDLPDLWLAIPASDLQQVLVNLLLNARDAMTLSQARRGGQLTVAAFADDHGRGVLEVRDTGPGIDPAILPRLFDPFVTTKRTPAPAPGTSATTPAPGVPGTSGGPQGTGLGLPISRDLCRRAAGDLTATNAPPPASGATFRITLPLADAAAPPRHLGS